MNNDNQRTLKICFVFSPSFSLTLNPFAMQGGGVFTFYTDEDEFLESLQKQIDIKGYRWEVSKDTTHADGAEIKKSGFDYILLAPGLKFMFYKNGFERRKIIYLDFYDFNTSDVESIIVKMNEVINGK